MSEVAWLAAHADTPVIAGDVRRWAEAVEAALHPRMEGLTRRERVTQHLLLVAWSDDDHPPATWPQVEATPAALGVQDGFPIGFDRLGLSRPSPIAIAEALDGRHDDIARLQPPLVTIALGDRLTLALDEVGLGIAYHASAAGRTAWSSSPALASLFVYGDLASSADGWVGMLAHGRFLGDTSPLSGVHRLAGGVRITARDRPGGIEQHRIDLARTVFDSDPGDDEATAAAMIDALGALFGSMQRLDVGQPTFTLSGGRDSRVLAAVALAGGHVPAFWTSSPPELDVRIARELTDRLDPPLPWTVRDKTEEVRDQQRRLAATTGPDDYWERALRHQAVIEGQGDVPPHVTPQRSMAAIGGPRIWGLGGEFARSFFYFEDALRDPDGRTRQFWTGLREASRLIHHAARRELLVPAIDRIRGGYAERGIEGLAQLDAFYVFERIRRWKVRTRATQGMWPYFTHGYLMTIGRRPADRVRTRYYERVVERAYPSWAGIPYAHERKAEDPEAATARSYADVYWSSPAVSAIAAEALHRLEHDPLLEAGQLARVIRSGGAPDGRAVARMSQLNQVLDYVTYQAHLVAVRERYRAAGGPIAVARPPTAWARPPEPLIRRGAFAPRALARSVARRLPEPIRGAMRRGLATARRGVALVRSVSRR